MTFLTVYIYYRLFARSQSVV